MSSEDLACSFLDGQYSALAKGLGAGSSPLLLRLRCDALLAIGGDAYEALQAAQALLSAEPSVAMHHFRKG